MTTPPPVLAAPAPPKPLERGRDLLRAPWFWALVAIALLLVVNLVKDPGYLALSINPQNGNLVGNLIDILRVSAPVIMIAVGMSLVVATRGIDLSVGSIMVVSGAVSMEFLKSAAAADSVGAALAAVGLALLVSTLIGAVNGVLITTLGLQPFISTLIMMLAGPGIAKVITAGQNTNAANAPFQWIANGYVVGLPVVFLLAVGITVLVALIVRRSAFGLMIEAIGINPAASRMAGIRPAGFVVAVYTLSGLLAGIAGIFAVGSVMTVDISRTGYQLELDAILAVVIGGTSLAGGRFSIGGAFVGALLIATLDKTIVFLGIPASATPAFKGRRDRPAVPAAVAAGPRPVRATPSGDTVRPGRPARRGRLTHHRREQCMTATPIASRIPAAQRLVERTRTAFRSNPSVLPTLAAVVITIAMIVYGEIAYGRILQYNTLSNLLINNAHVIILAVGMTFVILTGGIDLSVGAVIAVSSVAGVMLANAGWNPWLAVLVMILIGTATGAVSGVLIQYFDVQPFIATLAMMFLGRGLASILSTEPQRLADDSPMRALGAPITIIDGPKVNDLVVTGGVVIAVALVLAALFVLHRTRLGRTVYAIGGSEASAKLMGLPVHRTKLTVYLVSGTLAGVAAVVYTARLGIGQNITGIGWELDAIAATVIGGTLLTGGAGFVLGSVVGAIVLGLMNVLITRDGTIKPETVTIITGGILLVFVLLQRAVTRRKDE